MAVAKPDRIILFGSAATGRMTKDSDIDLLIVEPTAESGHEERVTITDAIGDVRCSFIEPRYVPDPWLSGR